MLANCTPERVSRDIVHVRFAYSTSTSPLCSAVSRCCAVSETNFTLFASPKIAAAIARHESASMPRITPWLSGSEKPADEPITPQMRLPRALTAASVGDAAAAGAPPAGAFCASAPNAARPAAAHATHVFIEIFIASSFECGWRMRPSSEHDARGFVVERGEHAD